MNQKRSIFISCFICLAIVVSVIGICFLLGKGTEPVKTAENCEELELYVNFPSGTERVNIWRNEEGIYYFFIPSGGGDCKITFGNLGDGSSVRLGEETFGAKDDLRAFLNAQPGGQTLELTMEVEGQKQEPIQIGFLQSAGIAAMFIDTDSGSVEAIHGDKEVREAADMRLVDGAGNRRFSGGLEYIKTRGNSTWGFEKKAYQVKLAREAGLLDMAAAKKWILLANVLDDTLMKNEIVYRYAEKYSTVPTIDGRYVDLYINGDYLGNYYLCEKVEVGRNRLKLTDLGEATRAVNNNGKYENASLYVSEDGRIKATQGLDNPADITGGYLLEHITVSEFEEEENAFQTQTGHCYAIISPSPATVEQAEYICGLLDELEAAIMQEDGVNPATGKHFSEYLDLDSWAAKYVMEESFHDPDSIVASMYLYKERDSIDPLIYSGPMWDYDRALGSYGMNIYEIDSALQIGEYGLYVDQLMRFDEVSSLVYEKFQEEMAPYVKYRARADIYELNQQIEASARMDAVRWGQVYGYYVGRDASVDYLAWFLEEKADYLQDAWLGEDDYCTVTFLDYYGGVYRTYKVKRGERFFEIPVISSYVAVFAGWYVQGEDIPYISGLPILEDVTYESEWVDINLILQNGISGLDMDLSQMDPEMFENMAEVLREMQKAALEEKEGDLKP